MYEKCTTKIQHTPVLKKNAVILQGIVENSKLVSYDDMYWSTSSNTISSIFNATIFVSKKYLATIPLTCVNATTVASKDLSFA